MYWGRSTGYIRPRFRRFTRRVEELVSLAAFHLFFGRDRLKRAIQTQQLEEELYRQKDRVARVIVRAVWHEMHRWSIPANLTYLDDLVPHWLSLDAQARELDRDQYGDLCDGTARVCRARGHLAALMTDVEMGLGYNLGQRLNPPQAQLTMSWEDGN